MQNPPGPEQSATMALALIEELIRKLDLGGLIKAEEIYQAAIGVLSDERHKLRSESAAFLRERLTQRS